MKNNVEIGEQVVISLIGKDFKDNHYSSNRDCAVSRACNRFFGIKNANVGGDDVDILVNDVVLRYEFDCSKETGFNSSDFGIAQERLNSGDLKPRNLFRKLTLTRVL